MIKTIVAIALIAYVVFLAIYMAVHAYKNRTSSKQNPVISTYDFPYYHTVFTCPNCGHRFTDTEIDAVDKCEVCQQKILWT